jgi:cyclase
LVNLASGLAVEETMTRARVLGSLVILGVMSIGVTAYQQPAANAPKVITVDKVKPNLFVLKGGGGNTAVFVTTNGVVVVDAKNPGWGQPILDKIKELTDKPVTTLINTHTHGDHVSGNVEFPASVDVIVQANTKTNMEKMDIFKQNANRGMAKRTFTDRMTIGKGADQIDLYYFGPGHTNGDAWVVFPALRTVHIGDIFASKGLPLIDAANGGSVLHIHESLNKGYNGIKGVDTVINGHSDTTTTWADVKQFADFNQDFLTWAQSELKAGKTPEQAASEWKVPAKYASAGYSSQVSANFGGLAGRIQRLQEEMK